MVETASKNDVFDVAIVGAGPIGASLACRLVQQGLRVIIFEKQALQPMEDYLYDGRSYAVTSSSCRYLKEAGIWQHLPVQAQAIRSIRVIDGRDGGLSSPFFLDLKDNHDSESFGWMCEARHLRTALNQALRNERTLKILTSIEVSIHYHSSHAVISTSEHSCFAAKLVVGADGRQSKVREQAHIPVTLLPDYHQHALVCTIAHELPHYGSALEHFFPNGPFAQLPMPPSETHRHVSAIVLADVPNRSRYYHGLSDDYLAEVIQKLLGDDLGKVKIIGHRWIYPLSAQYAHRYYGHRMALVGDAAHGIHPLGGQGMNLGFRDLIVLTPLLVKAHERGEDFGDASLLREYQAGARPKNMMVMTLTDLLDRFFSNNSFVLRSIRRAAIAGLDRIGPLKRRLVQEIVNL